jgi:plasmid stabilization system protein ParE
MASKLIWTNNAIKDLENIKLYLEANWPYKVLLSFLDELLNKLFFIERFPEMGRQSSKFINRRMLTITKHNVLIYTVYKDEIVIEAIFDTRQDGKKLQF